MTPSRNGNGGLDREARAELERLARSPAESGRARLAKLGAIRTLERLNRSQRDAPPMPDGWHPGPPEFEELDRVYLAEHPEIRQRWYETLWRIGRA